MPDDEKLDIFHTMSGPEAEKEAKEQAASEATDLAGLKQHIDAPKLDGYLMLRSIGTGGYAQVWEAIQLRTRRFVAVKVFHKKGLVHWNLLQREADRMIRLDKHPHIVSLLDADLRGEIPYYVMDLGQDGSLESYLQTIKNTQLNPKQVNQAATWVQEIAEALHYVHTREIIHCDLKPANVLLDQEGHVRVADFGHSIVLTDSGGALGSLFYMAPEQAMTAEQGHLIQPDVRWDIYALGCTAYALLSGHPPHEDISMELESTPVIATRLKIYRKAIETQPVPDLYTLTHGRVDKDLSAIVAKCMKVNPDERYNEVSEILKDLKRRWQGKPVSPLAGDWVYSLRKYAHRYRVIITAITIVAVITLLAGFMMVEHQKAHAQDMALSTLLRGKDYLDNGDEATASAYFAEANQIYPSLLARGNALMHLPPVPSDIFNTEKPIQTLALSRDGHSLLTTGTSNAILWNLKDNSDHVLKSSGKNTVAAFSPEGSRVATGDNRGEIKVFETSTQKQISKMTEPDGELTALAFSPNGRQLATACDYGTIHFWSATTGKLSTITFNPGPGVYSVEYSHDGKYLLTATKEGKAQVWDIQNGEAKCDPIHLDTKNAQAWYRPDVFFLADGKTFATTGWDGTLRFYERNGNRISRSISLDGLGAKAFLSASGHQLVTAVLQNKTTGLIRLYGVHSHNPTPFKFKTNGRITTFALSTDGSRVMAGSADHTALVWLTENGKPLSHALWHGDMVTSGVFSPAGKNLITGSKDGVARIWNFAAATDNVTELDWKKAGRKGYEKNQSNRLFSRDSKSLLTYSSKNAWLWDATTGKAQGVLMTAPGTIKTALFSPDDKKLLLFGKSGAQLWDLDSKKGLVLKTDGTLVGADFSADSHKIVIATKEKNLVFFDVSNSMQQGQPLTLDNHLTQVKLSPDGNQVAVLTDKNYLRLYSAQGGAALLKIDKSVKSFAFTADNQMLLVAVSGTGSVYDAAKGKLLKSFKHPGVNAILSTPDSKTIITFGSNGTGCLWDARTGDPLGNPMKHEGDVAQMVLGPKGNALLVVYKDKNREIWDTHSGETIGGEISNGSTVKALAFDKDSRGYKMVDAKGKIIHVLTDWVDPNMDPERLVKTSEVAGLCKVSSQGFVQTISADSWVSLWKEFKKTLTPAN